MDVFIYLLGYFFLYFLIKKERGEENDWSDVIITISLSLFSWFGVFMMGLLFIINYKGKIKPPKWM